MLLLQHIYRITGHLCPMIYGCMCVCMYVYIYMCVCVYVCICIVYVYICVYICVCIYIMYIYVCVCVYMYMCVCVCMCMYILCKRPYILQHAHAIRSNMNGHFFQKGHTYDKIMQLTKKN